MIYAPYSNFGHSIARRPFPHSVLEDHKGDLVDLDILDRADNFRACATRPFIDELYSFLDIIDDWLDIFDDWRNIFSD